MMIIYKIVDANKNKVNFIKDLYNEVLFLFNNPSDYDNKILSKWNDNTNDILNKLNNEFIELDCWNSYNIQKTFENYVNKNNLKFSDVAPFLRLVLTGKSNGQSMFDIMEILGRYESLKRLINYDKIFEKC